MEAEAITIGKKIKALADSLGPAHKELEKAAFTYALKKAEYDKAMGLTIMRLKGGETMVLDGVSIQNPAIGIMDKTVKAITSTEELAFLYAEASYKVAVSKIDSIRAKLMGYQSIYKHLSHLP